MFYWLTKESYAQILKILTLWIWIYQPALPQAIGKNSKDAPLLRNLIKDTLPLMEEEEVKITLAPGGFELGISRLRDRRSNQFATITAQVMRNVKEGAQ